VCGYFEAPNGETYYNSGTYQISIPAIGGCDSLITLQLTVLKHSPITIVTLSACGSFTTPSGEHTWIHSGTYFESLPNAIGCDSLIIYHLTIGENADTTMLNISSCHSYTTPDGLYTWTDSGFHEVHYLNIFGCDSLLLYQLDILEDHPFQYAVSTCDAYTTPDGLYTWDTSGIYSYQIMTTTGCDSLITVELDITPINTELITTDFISGSSTRRRYLSMAQLHHR
jgi:hypothetical protein